MVYTTATPTGAMATETTRLRRLAVGSALGVGGLLVGTVLPLVAVLLVGAFVPLAFGGLFAVGTLFFGLGLVLVSVWFVTSTGRGLGYFDLRLPGVRDLLYAIGGIVALVCVAIAVGLVFSALNVPTAENSIESTAREGGAEVLLWAIPLAWLAIGLGEELVFRGVVQNYLEEGFSTAGAILASSVIFALVHIPAYYSPNPLATGSVLVVVFCLSVVLGVTYVRTRNLLVPILIHGTYNAIVFLSLYVALTGDVP